MTPTDTDRFLAAVRSEAVAGLDVAPEDVLRLLEIVEDLGREVLRLKASEKAPASEDRWLSKALALEQDLGELPPGGASGGAARSPVCPDCRGRGGACLTCAGDGLLGGAR